MGLFDGLFENPLNKIERYEDCIFVLDTLKIYNRSDLNKMQIIIHDRFHKLAFETRDMIHWDCNGTKLCHQDEKKLIDMLNDFVSFIPKIYIP